MAEEPKPNILQRVENEPEPPAPTPPPAPAPPPAPKPIDPGKQLDPTAMMAAIAQILNAVIAFLEQVMALLGNAPQLAALFQEIMSAAAVFGA